MQVALNIEDWLVAQDKFTQKLARGVKLHQITIKTYAYTLIYVKSKENIWLSL